MHGLLDIELPNDRIYDSYDLTPMLLGEGPSARELLFYYRGYDLMAVRKGPWKMHLITQSGYANDRTEHDPPLLFQIEHDPSEQYNVAKGNPQVITEIMAAVESHRGGARSRGFATGALIRLSPPCPPLPRRDKCGTMDTKFTAIRAARRCAAASGADRQRPRGVRLARYIPVSSASS